MKKTLAIAIYLAVPAVVGATVNCRTMTWPNGNSTTYCNDGSTYDTYSYKNYDTIIRRGEPGRWVKQKNKDGSSVTTRPGTTQYMRRFQDRTSGRYPDNETDRRILPSIID